MIWRVNLLEIKLKNILPSTFRSAMSRKSGNLPGSGSSTFGMNVLKAILHCTGTRFNRRQSKQSWKRYLAMSGHLLYTLYGFWFGPGRDPFRRDLITALNSSEEKGEVSNFTLTEGGSGSSSRSGRGVSFSGSECKLFRIRSSS